MHANLEEAIKAEQRAYFRKWRANNKDKVRKHNENYWKKRVLQRQGAEDEQKQEIRTN